MHYRSCALVAMFTWSSVGVAQQGRAPDPHWGAEIFPRDEYEWRTSLSFSRFTEYSSTSLDRANPTRGKYNQDVGKSGGFNLLNLQHTDEIRFREVDKWTYTWNLGIGNAGNEPTSFLQNDYLHKLTGQNDVPVLETESGFAWSAGGAVNYWFGDHSFVHRDVEVEDQSSNLSFVVGAGAVASSIYYEPEVHAGLAWDIPRYNLRATGLHRVSTPIGGETYRDVADFAQVSQGSLYYIPSNFYVRPGWSWEDLSPHRWPSLLHAAIGRPDFGIHITHDTGLFEDIANNGISTWFVSGSFEWASGVRVEIWNDILNGTDRGPTFGMMIGVDILTLSDRFFGDK